MLDAEPELVDIPGIPKGNFDKITGVVSDNVTKMTQDVINGEARLHDRGPDGRPAAGGPAEVRGPLSARTPNPPNDYYNFLNVTMPPFDKQEARQAVNYAIDSSALVRVFGGRLTPGCNFLPPGVVGYKEIDCKYGDPDGEPATSRRRRSSSKQSGYEGETVTYWTNNKDPRPAIARLLRATC